MMFGLKYLQPDEIPTWFRSIMTIDEIHWRGNFLVWLLGAYDLLKSGNVDPAKFQKFTPYISWDEIAFLNSEKRDSDDVRRPFLSETNVNVFLQEIDNLFTFELLAEWADSFETDYLVGISTRGVPDALYNKLSAYRMAE